MRRLALAVLLPACLGLVGCKDESRLGYLELGGHVFVFNPRIATAVYAVSFNRLKDIPSGSKLVVIFEDPAGGPELVTVVPVRGNETKFGIESEALDCIKKGRPYAFSAQLLDDKGKELQKIESSVTSSLDQDILPDKPLVTGPAYEPNPELKVDEEGKYIRTKPQNCPA